MFDYHWNAHLAYYLDQANTRRMFEKLTERGGATLAPNLSVRMADNGQHIELAGLRFNRQRGFDPEGEPIGRDSLTLIWESQCMVCGGAYEFRTKSQPTYLTRTCEEHRGATKSAAQTPPLARFGKHERHVLEMIEDEFADDSDADLDLFLRWCVSAMPAPKEGKRDVRRFEVFRAIQSLAKRKDAPLRLERNRVVFCA